MVLVDNELMHTSVDSIQIADEEGGYLATRHLIEHGYKTIASLTGCQEWISCRNRTAGYKRAMNESGLSTLIEIQNAASQETGYRALLNVFAIEPGVSAIFCQNDTMAIGAIKGAAETGKRVPDDLAVIGFDEIDLASHTTPNLTTMRVPKEYLGILAARRIVDLPTLSVDKQQIPVTTLVSTELVIRSSCGCNRLPVQTG